MYKTTRNPFKKLRFWFISRRDLLESTDATIDRLATQLLEAEIRAHKAEEKLQEYKKKQLDQLYGGPSIN